MGVRESFIFLGNLRPVNGSRVGNWCKTQSHVENRPESGSVMSVWLTVTMFPWDRRFTYLVWKVSLSLIIPVHFMKSVVFLSDVFLKEATIFLRSPRFDFPVALAAFRPENAFFDLTAKSNPGVIILMISVKIVF